VSPEQQAKIHPRDLHRGLVKLFAGCWVPVAKENCEPGTENSKEIGRTEFEASQETTTGRYEIFQRAGAKSREP
jgi:hypothetical protein